MSQARRLLFWAGGLALVSLGAFEAQGVTFHVAQDGNDAWSGRAADAGHGTCDGPFATLERARDAVRELRRAERWPSDGVVVEISGGLHRRGQPLALSAADSGDEGAPVVYRGRPGEQVVLSGGRRIDAWHPVTDPGALGRLPPCARGHVFQADLRALGIGDCGALGMDVEAGI